MNKPLAEPKASSANPLNTGGRSLPGAPPGLAQDSHRSVRVLLFSDRRSSEGRPAAPRSEIASHYARERLPIDRILITRLFIRALQRAGHDPLPEPVGFAVERSMAPEPVMLEGRIWRLQFQTGPAPTLELDLSLTLYDLQPSAILWKMDIPTDGTLPFWIGLGCKPEEMVPAALEELEAAAMLHFRSEQFIRAIGGQIARRETASPDPGGSHKVVASTSWTTSEQGQITATAHESGTQAHANDMSGEDLRLPAAVKRVARGQQAEETARAL